MSKVDVERLKTYLDGTCHRIDKGLEVQGLTTDDMTASDWHELESDIMRCESCQWWVEASEIDEEGNCHSCHEEVEDGT